MYTFVIATMSIYVGHFIPLTKENKTNIKETIEIIEGKKEKRPNNETIDNKELL